MAPNHWEGVRLEILKISAKRKKFHNFKPDPSPHFGGGGVHCAFGFPSADPVNDEATADLLTQRMEVHEKTAWMLRSLLEG